MSCSRRNRKELALRLVEELNGSVAQVVLCVDSDGKVLEAAFPEPWAKARNLVRGQRLDCLSHEAEPTPGFWKTELARNGGLRLTINLSPDICEAQILGFDREHGATRSLQAQLEPLAALPFPLLGIDVTGRIEWLNASAAAFLRRPASELLGVRISSLLAGGGSTKDLRLDLAAGEWAPTQVMLHCSATETREVKIDPVRVHAPEGELQGWGIPLRPVTSTEGDPPRHLADQGEEGLQNMLRKLAHDLHSPVCSLRAFSELLERDFGTRLDSLGKRYLTRLRSSTESIQRLAEDIGELARIRSVENERCWIASREVLARLTTELKPELETRVIELIMPECPEPVYANPERFEQVVSNLIENAIHHLGEVENPRIEVRIENRDRGTILEVRDNGRGISPDLGILEFFSRSMGGRPLCSFGLGFSIVKRIVLSHGGHIEVDTKPGRGSILRAFFPSP